MFAATSALPSSPAAASAIPTSALFELIMTLVSAGRESLALSDAYAADAALCAIERAAEHALSTLDKNCEIA